MKKREKHLYSILTIMTILLVGVSFTLISCGSGTHTPGDSPNLVNIGFMATPTNTPTIVIPTATNTPTSTPTNTPTSTPTEKPDLTNLVIRSGWIYQFGSVEFNFFSMQLFFTNQVSSQSFQINDFEILQEDNPTIPFTQIDGNIVSGNGSSQGGSFSWTFEEVRASGTNALIGFRWVAPDGTFIQDNDDTNFGVDFAPALDLTSSFPSSLLIRVHVTENGVNRGYITLPIENG